MVGTRGVEPRLVASQATGLDRYPTHPMMVLAAGFEPAMEPYGSRFPKWSFELASFKLTALSKFRPQEGLALCLTRSAAFDRLATPACDGSIGWS